VSVPLKVKFILAACMGILAVVFGVQRLKQTEIHQSAAVLAFGEPMNSFHWDPATGELSRTGGDPYAFLRLPSDSIPLDELVLVCKGTPPPGTSFVYPSPAYLPHTDINDRLAVAGVVEPTADGFRIRYALGGSKIARLDLSDEITAPIVIKEAVFHSRFLVGDNPTFRWFAASAGACVLLLIWIGVGPWITRSRAVEAVAVAALIALKLWLSGDMHMTIYADARHDDALFLSQAASIVSGEWLGKFGELTLAKGPSYSIFIALAHLAHIPLLDAQAMLHALACLLFVLAVRPVVASPLVRLLLLAALLFDPHPFSSEAGERALRSSIQPALTLFTLSGVIGMLLRTAQEPALLLSWSVLGGIGLAAFWFSREEGIWLVPTLVLITGAALWRVWRNPVAQKAVRIACLLAPFVIGVSALWALRAVNHAHYGAWISVDMKDGGFPAAYGALTRITPAEIITGVPVTKETRLRAYAVSPALAELQPVLEGRTGNTWASHGWEQLPDHPLAKQEIRAGWLPWALRQAALESGYYQDARGTSLYWQRVADEVNAACDNGTLHGGPRRAGFYPRWQSSLWGPLGSSLRGAVAVVTRFSDYKAQAYPSRGAPDDIARYGRLVRESPVMERLPPSLRTHVRQVVFRCYQAAGTPATLLAVIATLVLAVRVMRKTADSSLLAIDLGLLGGATSLIVLVALVDVTSFSALHAMYLSPATPLVIAAAVMAPYWAFRRPI
jgi:hypothetical protein